jgi:hypothetical protein
MRRILITPAGRQRYLELLYRHVLSQKNDFDEWQLWVNTVVPEDVAFCAELARRHSWIKPMPLTVPCNHGSSIFSFYNNCMDPSAMYLRMDDDVVWLEPTFIDKMFDYRARHPEFFLVFGNIVNNAAIAHIFQRAGLIGYEHGSCSFDCLCAVGWGSPEFARDLHVRFLRDISRGAIDRWRCFSEWQLPARERVSINAISFLGADIAKLNADVNPDEEPSMCCYLPEKLGKICCINGNALCAHFAFYAQRAALDATDLLAEYAKFAPGITV